MLARGVIAAGLGLSLLGIGVLAVNDFLGLEIRQALIAGLVVAAGWLVTFLVQDWNREVERRSRQTDIQLALRAEIQNSHLVFTQRDHDTAAFGQRVQRQILQAGDGAEAFHPFIVQDASMIVFDALKDGLHVLPARVIDEVVQFYCQLADLQAFAAQMNSADFRAMSANRRAGAYGHYIEMTIECENRARDALTQLGYSLGTYDDQGMLTAAADRQAALDHARKSLRNWISKTDPDRTGRSMDEAL